MANEPDTHRSDWWARAGDETAIREFLSRFEREVRIMVAAVFQDAAAPVRFDGFRSGGLEERLCRCRSSPGIRERPLCGLSGRGRPE